MADGKSICTQCGMAAPDMGVESLCPACANSQATILPTPFGAIDATVAPGQRKPDLISGRQIGDYDLIEEIARGGMGVVYKANHRDLNRLAAVKMILGGRFSSPEEVQRFRIEAESAAKLDHAAIVPIYEIGEHEGQAFFAMKYIDGGSLAEKATEFVQRPRDAVKLIAKVAEGVHHAHQRGVLHRDLKPANILLDREGQPWVADLGLAKSTSGGSDLTQTGAVLGTPTYMPPEQAAGKSVTTAADVYSLGAILYQLLVGRPPYQGDTTVSVVMQVVDAPPPSPRSVNPQVDRDLELIVQKCMSRDPEERYLSALDITNDLECWLEGKSISVQPPSIRALVGKWFRENEKLAYAAFAIFAGILLCAPAVLGFFSDDMSDVYARFEDTDKPLIFSVNTPRWLNGMSLVFLILILWPSIGFLNAAISRPQSFLGALRVGVSNSMILALIFYCLMGWLIFIQGADNSINDDVESLTKLTWPTGEVDDAVEMEDIYDGLEKVPESERAEVVAKRIKADMYASAPYAFLVGLAIAVGFAIPFIVGTIVGGVLLGRSIPIWVKLLRYLIAWWSLFVLFASLTSAALSIDINVQGSPLAGNLIIVFAITLFITWLALRRWRKNKRPQEVALA